MTGPLPVELSVVLPAHDEAATIEDVVRAVVAVAEHLAPDAHEVIVVDDGSTDATGAILDRLAAELPAVAVVHQVPNRGHGPALRAGFDLAVGAWIGHLDTDDQIPADQFERLWPERSAHDLVLGVRTDRHDPRHRLVVTRAVRAIVGRLAGRPIQDANVPCKLVGRDLWEAARPYVPTDTFAPSVALAVAAVRLGRPVAQVPVQHQARPHGTSSLKPVRLARGLGTAAVQTVRLARALPAAPAGRP
ncbi:hypothetical protein BH10ACT1_BH10ACT1_15080 [soil metagenome]